MRNIRNGDLAGLAILVGFAVVLSTYPLWHTDVWGHAAYGRWFREHRELPDLEPLSPFSDSGAKFIHFAWLAQVTYDALFRLGAAVAGGDRESQLIGGAEALRTGHWVLVVLRSLLFWAALRRVSGSAAWSAVGLLLSILAIGFGSAVQRPQAFGLFAFAAVLYALSAPIISRRAIVLLPLLFGIWANVHGTWVVGAALLFMHGLGKLIEQGPRSVAVRRIAVAGLLSALAVMVNPHGPKLITNVLLFSGHPNLKTMLEWFPMRISDGSNAYQTYFATIALLAMAHFLGSRRIGPAGWAAAVPLAIWPWYQERALLWWWLIVLWLVARVGPGLAERFPTLPSIPDGRPARWRAVATGALVVILIASAPAWRTAMFGKSPAEVVSEATPWRIAFELSAQPADHGNWQPSLRAYLDALHDGQLKGTFFASETQGDFLVWELPPRSPIGMFTHAHIFTETYWNECLEVKLPEFDRPESTTIFHRYLSERSVNLILVETASHPELTKWLRNNEDWIILADEDEDPDTIPPKSRRILAGRRIPVGVHPVSR